MQKPPKGEAPGVTTEEARQPKRPYAPPRLIVHGSVERITEIPFGGKKVEKHPFKPGSKIRPKP